MDHHTRHIRVAAAQSFVGNDRRGGDQVRESSRAVRALMRAAAAAGARLVHFSEGAASCYPLKNARRLEDGSRELLPADWASFTWDVLDAELAEIAALAGELGLWTVVGSLHRLSGAHRPHNSLYVISDRGQLVTRYDKRFLSPNELEWMYTPGTEAVTFEVDGVRFGCAICLDVRFPEVFTEYERLEVDCVLFSTTAADDDAFARLAAGHAVVNGYWVSYSGPSQTGATAPAGVAGPDGRWAAQCAGRDADAVAVADVSASPEVQWWRRRARSGAYEPHMVDDPRSGDRTRF